MMSAIDFVALIVKLCIKCKIRKIINRIEPESERNDRTKKNDGSTQINGNSIVTMNSCMASNFKGRSVYGGYLSKGHLTQIRLEE